MLSSSRRLSTPMKRRRKRCNRSEQCRHTSASATSTASSYSKKTPTTLRRRLWQLPERSGARCRRRSAQSTSRSTPRTNSAKRNSLQISKAKATSFSKTVARALMKKTCPSPVATPKRLTRVSWKRREGFRLRESLSKRLLRCD